MTYSIFYSTKALEVFLWGILAVAGLLAFTVPRLGARAARSTKLRFRFLLHRRWAAVALAALLPMLVRLVLLPVLPLPEPRVHDEFSNLLLGDTFAHGRLTNPAPPYWQHFETEYELMRPTYASQYQPGQGLFLGVGQIVFGHPWWGVWCSVGMMCGALCWALYPTLPARWAFFGAVLAALQVGILGFWMNSYFGGSVAALGGALLFGSLTRPATLSVSVLRAVALIILFATRPAEALIWLGAAIWVMFRTVPAKIGGLVVSLAVLGAGFSALGYYNQRVTGSATTLPYALYRRTYGTPQSYWWQPAVLVTSFDNAQLAANYQDQLRYWNRRYSARALYDASWRRLRDFWRFFIGPLLTPAVLFAGAIWKKRPIRFWLWVSVAFVMDHATFHAWYPQQSAPETVLIVLFLVYGWRHLRAWQRSSGVGPAMSRNILAGFVLALSLLGTGLVLKRISPAVLSGQHSVLASLVSTPSARERVISHLGALPGKHLVFVRYRQGHPWYDEWVFNGADIPGSRIVFARLRTSQSNVALACALSGRSIWIADPDAALPLKRLTSQQLLTGDNDLESRIAESREGGKKSNGAN